MTEAGLIPDRAISGVVVRSSIVAFKERADAGNAENNITKKYCGKARAAPKNDSQLGFEKAQQDSCLEGYTECQRYDPKSIPPVGSRGEQK